MRRTRPWLGTQKQQQQLSVAQKIEDLLAAIAPPLNQTQHRVRMMLIDQNGLVKPLVFSGKKEDVHGWAKKIENHVAGVHPSARAALLYALRTGVSGRGVGVDRPEHSDLDGPTSVQIDAQLFVMLSALADGKLRHRDIIERCPYVGCARDGAHTTLDVHAVSWETSCHHHARRCAN